MNNQVILTYRLLFFILIFGALCGWFLRKAYDMRSSPTVTTVDV